MGLLLSEVTRCQLCPLDDRRNRCKIEISTIKVLSAKLCILFHALHLPTYLPTYVLHALMAITVRLKFQPS